MRERRKKRVCYNLKHTHTKKNQCQIELFAIEFSSEREERKKKRVSYNLKYTVRKINCKLKNMYNWAFFCEREREREREERLREEEEEEGAKESTNAATVSQKAVSCTLNNRWVIRVTTGS
jgi:hypothetical protein